MHIAKAKWISMGLKKKTQHTPINADFHTQNER